MKPKKQVRQMISVDNLPDHVRDAMMRSNGRPVTILIPKYESLSAKRRTDRERKIL